MTRRHAASAVPRHTRSPAPVPVLQPVSQPEAQPPALLTRVRAGDADAFAVLYEHWFDVAVLMARRCTGRDEPFALDVAQEVMLRVARRAPIVSSEAQWYAWLARAVLRRCITQLRSDTRRRAHERASTKATATQGRAAPTPLTIAEHSECVDALRAAVRALGPAADLLRARFAMGRTLEQAARSLDVSRDAVHGRARRVLEEVRLSMQQHADDRAPMLTEFKR